MIDYAAIIMDPLQAAGRLPKIAQRSMRDAVFAQPRGRGRASDRRLVDAALLRFERCVEREGMAVVGQSLLFAERDRIVREMRTFASSRLAARLFAVSTDRVLTGGNAAPFDAVVRDRSGHCYGIVLRRLSKTSGRLESYRRVRDAAGAATQAVRAVVLYDWVSGATRVLPAARLREAGAQRHDRDLRSRRKVQFGQNMRDVILDGLVA